ncbi:MAG TPA: Gfo/Idh/MocA family oxidoreductase [Acidimicrobiales bacterium]|nr:Gfo/Idh/MocA family oxidoreductase [Acidimicrobiales bacterium]
MKVGVLSFAHTHAAGYVHELSTLPGIEVLATDPDGVSSDPAQPRGRALAEQLGVAYADTYEDVFAWGPDAVIVTAENSRHRPLVELAARHGVDVLCEKPLATSQADGEAMVAACREAGVRLGVAYPVRFHRAYAAVKAAAASGALGEILLVTGANNGRLPAGARAWFVDPELAGGGALMDHTVHIADLVDDLLDGQPAVEVYAQANNLLYEGTVSVETAGLVTVRYANGVIVTIDCSWSQPLSHPRWGGVEVQVIGTGAVAEMDAFGQLVGGWDQRDKTAFALPWGSDLDHDLLSSFLLGTSPTGMTVADGEAGLRSLRVALGAMESARSGQAVRLD